MVFLSGLDRLNGRKDVVRFRPLGEVCLDEGPANSPLAVDDIGRRDGQFVRFVTVPIGQVDPDLPVKRPQRLGESEDEAERSRIGVVSIHGDGEPDAMGLRRLCRAIDNFRRDRDDGGTRLLEVVRAQGESAESDVAVWTPATSIENQDQRTCSAGRLEIDAAAAHGWESRKLRPRAGIGGALRETGIMKFADRPADRGKDMSGNSFLDGLHRSRQIFSEGHGGNSVSVEDETSLSR